MKNFGGVRVPEITRKWLEAPLGLEERVQALLEDMSDDECVEILVGHFEPFEARLLPAPAYVDAGTGLRGVEGATAFPCGTALAATFDTSLAGEVGGAVAKEARKHGFNVVLGPTVDLARDPAGGRLGEAFGEDPELSGQMGAAHVQGAQNEHVIAQVKHFVAYNSETRRTGFGLPTRGDAMNVRCSAEDLHDIYLRPFEAVVRAGAWSLMGSYNQLNGQYVCEQAEVLGIPRREWGWQGFYCPDFLFAVRDPRRALDAGLDLGALGGAGGRTPEMVRDVLKGNEIRHAVGNVARAFLGCGLIDDPLSSDEEYDQQNHVALAQHIAAEASVLLRNEGSLPLEDIRSLALIGPTGADAMYTVGGAAAVTLSPGRVSTPVDAIKARAEQSGVEIRVAQGSLGDVPLPTVPSSVLKVPGEATNGVVLEFEDGAEPRTRVVSEFRFGDISFDSLDQCPRRLRATLMPRRTGTHRFSLSFGGQARVLFDGVVVSEGSREAAQFIQGPKYPLQWIHELRKGEGIEVEIEYSIGPAVIIPDFGVGPSLELGWQEPDALLEEAVLAAEEADVAVVMVNMAMGEGMDRASLLLPGDQNELVRRVAAANANTIVVLNLGGAVELPWADQVSAILHMWLPGEQFGEALAALLFGDVEPGGRLPVTFPRIASDMPDSPDGFDVPEYLDYEQDEGIGYFGQGTQTRGARFPFGHGLGYAEVELTAEGRKTASGDLEISVTGTNQSARKGKCVAQVYWLRDGHAARRLVDFVPFIVGPMQSETRVITLGPKSWRIWSEAENKLVPARGVQRFVVATSAQAPGTEITHITD